MPSRSKDAPFRLIYQILSGPSLHHPVNRSICTQCRRAQFLRPAAYAPTRQQPLHQFSTSSALGKKSSASSKSSRKNPDLSSLTHEDAKHIPDNKATRNRDAEIDPYDFSELNAGIAKAVARLKDALVKTRDAGRVTPEMIEGLPVEINVKGKETHGASAHKEREKIGDLASVVAKGGRMVQVFCAEESVRYSRSFSLHLPSIYLDTFLLESDRPPPVVR